MDQKNLLLVVDDEKPLVRALVDKLSTAGINATSAYSGEDALQHLRKEAFGLVLLDLVMANVDGFEVLEKMKAEKIAVPTIVLSNLGEDEAKSRAKALGAMEFMVKSDTQISDVVKHVTEILEQK